MRVYLDNSASTKEDPRVLRAMLPYFKKYYANPSSLHYFGQEALAGIDWARSAIKDYLNADLNLEIIFTASASEANNSAIKGAAFAYFREHEKPGHIVTTNIEHESVIQSCRDLQALGLARVDFAKANKEGLVQVKEIIKLIKPETILVSIVYVNNVIGSIQLIKAISQAIKKLNHGVLLHIDAAQGILTQAADVKDLGVDLMTFSGHKIYGPKGAAGLYIKVNSPLMPLVSGGEQEYGLRGSTPNTPAIVGLGKAFEILKKEQPKIIKHLKLLKNYFYKEIRKIKGARLNGSFENTSPHILNFYFPQKSAQDLLIALDLKGIAVSAGSACAARSLEPAKTILAISGSEKIAKQSIRFSFSKYTTLSELKYTLEVLKNLLAE